jgi:hypothetical protein
MTKGYRFRFTPPLRRVYEFVWRELQDGNGFPSIRAIMRAMSWRSPRSAAYAVERLGTLGLLVHDGRTWSLAPFRAAQRQDSLTVDTTLAPWQDDDGTWTMTE